MDPGKHVGWLAATLALVRTILRCFLVDRRPAKSDVVAGEAACWICWTGSYSNKFTFEHEIVFLHQRTIKLCCEVQLLMAHD